MYNGITRFASRFRKHKGKKCVNPTELRHRTLHRFHHMLLVIIFADIFLLNSCGQTRRRKITSYFYIYPR